MLSVAVHKDMQEYQPKIIGKLTGRTLLCIAGAIGLSVAAGLYLYFVLGMEVSDNMLLIYAVSLPFWLCGFYRPKGMPFERFLPLWLSSNFGDNHLLYQSAATRCGLNATRDEKKGDVYDKRYRKFLDGTRGIEAYSPREGRVVE